jgi:hypothetical protein
MADLRRAIRSRNAAAVRVAAHALKGHVSNFTTSGVYNTARKLESLAEEGRLESAPFLFDEAKVELASLRKSLRNIRGQTGN